MEKGEGRREKREARSPKETFSAAFLIGSKRAGHWQRK
jgi:hypothetical protein